MTIQKPREDLFEVCRLLLEILSSHTQLPVPGEDVTRRVIRTALEDKETQGKLWCFHINWDLLLVPGSRIVMVMLRGDDTNALRLVEKTFKVGRTDNESINVEFSNKTHGEVLAELRAIKRGA